MFESPLLWPRPDWSLWRHIPQLRLYEAAALSLDIAPELAGLDKLDIITDRYQRRAYFEHAPWRHEFARRLKILLANVESGDLKAILPANEVDYSAIIRMVDFVRFAERVGFSLPEEFPHQRNAATHGAGKGELKVTERRSLLLVIAALLVLAGFSKERGASTRILQQLQRMGVQLSDDTVRRILKAVSEGLKDWKSG